MTGDAVEQTITAELRALHEPLPYTNSRGVRQCQHDSFDWPCPTMRLLDRLAVAVRGTGHAAYERGYTDAVAATSAAIQEHLHAEGYSFAALAVAAAEAPAARSRSGEDTPSEGAPCDWCGVPRLRHHDDLHNWRPGSPVAPQSKAEDQ